MWEFFNSLLEQSFRVDAMRCWEGAGIVPINARLPSAVQDGRFGAGPDSSPPILALSRQRRVTISSVNRADRLKTPKRTTSA